MLTNRCSRFTIRICAISCALNAGLLVVTVAGQQPTPTSKPAPQSDAGRPKSETRVTAAQSQKELRLEVLLDRALSRNPAIRKAQVELTAAQVALERARQEVARDVTAARMAVEMQQMQIEVAIARVDEAQQLISLGRQAATGAPAASPEASDKALTIQAQSKLTEAKAAVRLELAKLSELESRVQYLTGEPATPQRDGATAEGTITLTVEASPLATQSPGRIDPSSDPSTADMRAKLLAIAETPVSLQFTDTPFVDVIEYLSDLTKIRFVIHQPVAELAGRELFNVPITLNLSEMPFPAALSALEDQTARLRFVLRPYGVLITAERGEPSGSMTVDEFYRAQKRDATTPAAK